MHELSAAGWWFKTCEGRKIRSAYLPFLTQVLYRPHQNDRLRVMFGTSLHRYHTTTYTHASDSANRRTNDNTFVASIRRLGGLDLACPPRKTRLRVRSRMESIDFVDVKIIAMKRTSGLNGYVNKQNCRIWSEANPQAYVETPLHPDKLTVWCILWAGGILLQKR
ncbi:hypothetical protein TNCV_1381201 [Trichonephila clavipes]|nr:hypothetical protein TNCV_1381201 [Trichonephila clavipes]